MNEKNKMVAGVNQKPSGCLPISNFIFSERGWSVVGSTQTALAMLGQAFFGMALIHSFASKSLFFSSTVTCFMHWMQLYF